MMVAPKLRFKADDGSDFPDWEDKALGELFYISAGGDIDKNNCAAKQSEDYPYPVYANALANNGLYGYANYYKIDGDTFTVTGRGDVGHAVARHCMYVPIVRLLVCQPKMDEDVDFFAEQINYTRVFIESTGVPQLTAPQLSKIKVKRPSLPEQRKIADFLSAVDAVIAAQQAEVDAWEQRKKGVMQKLFSQEVRFKADDGSDFPDWEDKALGELFYISAGGDIDKNNCAAKQSEDYPYPVYANALANNGLYGYANYYKIDGDTFTVTGRGDVGHAVARHCMYVPIVRLLVCQPKMDEDVDFFAEQINYTRVFIESTGVPQLTAPQLSKIKVKRPSLPEQRKIADCLASMDEVIQKAKDELAKWQELKKGLIQQMFV